MGEKARAPSKADGPRVEGRVVEQGQEFSSHQGRKGATQVETDQTG